MIIKLNKLYEEELTDCQCTCPLQGTSTPVKGYHPQQNVNIAFVGEAPGAKEADYGIPFVGIAGGNFDDFLHELNLSRNEVFITNTVKCRPTVGNRGKKNRAPYASEIKACSGYLEKELTIVNPKLIITLGNIPLRRLLANNKATITDWHGTLFFYDDAKVFPLHHPGAITYNRKLTNVIGEDLKVLKRLVTLQK